jgi:hypothetical protein
MKYAQAYVTYFWQPGSECGRWLVRQHILKLGVYTAYPCPFEQLTSDQGSYEHVQRRVWRVQQEKMELRDGHATYVQYMHKYLDCFRFTFLPLGSLGGRGCANQ